MEQYKKSTDKVAVYIKEDTMGESGNSFAVYAITDRGLGREKNEDNLCCNTVYKTDVSEQHFEYGDSYPERTLLLGVFDGMGGMRNGEYASLRAAETACGCYRDLADKESGMTATSLVQELNQTICRENQEGGRKTGSTAVLMLVRGNRLRFVNVGDSRGYFCRGGEVRQMTFDHTEANSILAMQKEMGIELGTDLLKSKNALTQFLGIEEDEFILEPFQSEEIECIKKDIFMLCSDGLYGMVPEEDITEILASELDVKEKAEMLVMDALECGGKDNITVVLAEKI